MKSAITVFNDWVKSNKDDGMQKAHAPAVMDMIQFSISSLNKSFSFIDAGCGNGWVVRYMNSQILCNSALGIDGADEMIKKAKKSDRKGMYILSDLLDFIPEEKVDLVFSMEVFYYLNNPSELVNSIEKYWLKSGGRLIIGLDYYKENKDCYNWPEHVGTPMKMLSVLEWVDIFQLSGLTNVKYWQSCSNNDFIGTLVITGESV